MVARAYLDIPDKYFPAELKGLSGTYQHTQAQEIGSAVGRGRREFDPIWFFFDIFPCEARSKVCVRGRPLGYTGVALRIDFHCSPEQAASWPMPQRSPKA